MAFQENGGKVQACSGVITGWLTRDSSQGFAHTGIAMSIFFTPCFHCATLILFLCISLGQGCGRIEERKDKGKEKNPTNQTATL